MPSAHFLETARWIILTPLAVAIVYMVIDQYRWARRQDYRRTAWAGYLASARKVPVAGALIGTGAGVFAYGAMFVPLGAGFLRDVPSPGSAGAPTIFIAVIGLVLAAGAAEIIIGAILVMRSQSKMACDRPVASACRI